MTYIKPTAHAACLQGPESAPRRRLLAGLGAGFLLPQLVSCAAPQAPLRVGSIVFPGYELLFLARELDLLDPQQVRLVELRANTDTLRALAAGELEAAALTVDELMSARADGVDLRAILVFDVSAGADVVLALPGVTLKNLEGKRIGVEEGAVGGLMLSALLQAAGLRPSQILKVPMTLDNSDEVFRSGVVDAVVTAEPWWSSIEKLGGKLIFDSNAIPGRIVDVLAVRGDVLNQRREGLRHLVAAHFAALERFRAQPAVAGAYMAMRLRCMPDEVAQQFRGLELPDATANLKILRPGGTFDSTTQLLQRQMQEAGLLRASASLGDLAEASFLPL
jgi:NitT/TauT family transport system substrate-binding protein